MKELEDEVPVSFSSFFLGTGRSSYYRWLKSAPSRLARKKEICTQITNIFNESKETYGSPRVYSELKDRGLIVSENTVAKYMAELGLDARLKKKFKIQTTDSNHSDPIAPRVFKAEEESSMPCSPGQLLAGDITYLRVPGGFMYLSVVMDLFNREIVGWSLDNNLSKRGVMKALELAMRKRSPDSEVIFHSDRGSQYASEAYRNLLKSKNGIPSMSRKGNCYDNCYVESWFSSLKKEWIYRRKVESSEHLRKLVFEYIEAWYNTRRKHSSLGNMSPRQYKRLKVVS